MHTGTRISGRPRRTARAGGAHSQKMATMCVWRASAALTTPTRTPCGSQWPAISQPLRRPRVDRVVGARARVAERVRVHADALRQHADAAVAAAQGRNCLIGTQQRRQRRALQLLELEPML